MPKGGEPSDAAGVPAVAQDRADDVFALLELLGDVVGRDLDAPAVVGPAGGEAVASHAPAIEMQLEHAARRHIRPRPRDAAAERERPAQMRAGAPRLRWASDPLGPPVRLPQQAHFERGRFAPVRNIARRVPDAHAPEHALARPQLRPAPRDADAIAAADSAGVPEVGLRIEQRRRAGRDDPPRRLVRSTPGILHAPREPRHRLAESDGVAAVLGSQIHGLTPSDLVISDPVQRRHQVYPPAFPSMRFMSSNFREPGVHARRHAMSGKTAAS